MRKITMGSDYIVEEKQMTAGEIIRERIQEAPDYYSDGIVEQTEKKLKWNSNILAELVQLLHDKKILSDEEIMQLRDSVWH